jgi:hypothetical protein
MPEPITETWLREIGFRWEQPFENQLHKHWILMLGAAVANKTAFSSEDLMLELSICDEKEGTWHCWIRADYCGRYTRFVHVRHMRTQEEVTQLLTALAGFPFDKSLVHYGGLHKPEDVVRYRAYENRLEVRLAKEWGSRVERETGADPNKREVLRP